MSQPANGKTIWQEQSELQEWHEREYKREYPTSEFYTGRTLHPEGYDDLSDEEKERKERVANMLNNMLFSMGTNISSNFRTEEK
jgi:hypothetical protein